MDLEAVVLVKPDAYEEMGRSAVQGYFKADQRVLSALKGFVSGGEEQLRAKTGYSNEALPGESPTRTEFTLDDIKFELVTNVKVINPPYQTALDKITGFLEVLPNDWRQGIRRDNVRTYDGQPFVEWNYLMWNSLWYLSRITQLGVENKFEKITAPSDVAGMELKSLVIPLELMRDFHIETPGAAKLWYLAKKFLDDVVKTSIAPFEAELVSRAGVSVEEMPAETKKYWEQVENYLFVVKNVPSPRREPGKVIARMFEIPQKDKPKGSVALPVVPSPENYVQLLEDYRETIPVALKKWRDLDGKIGELVVFYYGVENDARVQGDFPFLQEYQLKRDGGRMFVSVQALYDRIKALEKDYKTNRLLRTHTVVPIL